MARERGSPQTKKSMLGPDGWGAAKCNTRGSSLFVATPPNTHVISSRRVANGSELSSLLSVTCYQQERWHFHKCEHRGKNKQTPEEYKCRLCERKMQPFHEEEKLMHQYEKSQNILIKNEDTFYAHTILNTPNLV